eukprot:TRINITY_DN12407_c0_g1_i1.p1 TRINITY_DN12407_c0_g1~~TRINITY_DN12407_c0_g1_i1.p1  ORF type:complete len:573 (-),score=166.70 TRINITY_DN12407_c0_g1_i1:15-1568(-)
MGKNNTYYYKKDITWLLHDPLIKKFREHKAWKQKVKRAKGKKEIDKLKILQENKPRYNLNHLVKERYPTFIDAIRDLDDALCMISLFSTLPSTVKIHQWRVEKCQKLLNEFQYYIVKSNSLRKTFISHKGIYYQAEILGEKVTWLAPHKFAQKVSREVDFKVMLSFLEFYEVLMGFVNFRLFSNIGLTYPPVIDASLSRNGEYLSSLKTQEEIERLESGNTPALTKGDKNESKSRVKTLSEVLKNVNEEDIMDQEEVPSSDEEEEDLDEFDEATKLLKLEQLIYKNLFKGCVFWIGRENPKESLEFIIKSLGGNVYWDGIGKTIDYEEITHQIIDRNGAVRNPILSREYVQPQYVYDCINAKCILPTEKYQPGVELPPHISPFVEEDVDGYIPEYQLELEDHYNRVHGLLEDVSDEDLENEQQSNEEDDETRYNDELDQEKGLVPQKRKRDIKDFDDEQDQKDTALALLPRKKRRLFQRYQYSIREKKARDEKKHDKLEKLQKGEAVVNDDGIIEYK